jgi:hypothetical protein
VFYTTVLWSSHLLGNAKENWGHFQHSSSPQEHYSESCKETSNNWHITWHKEKLLTDSINWRNSYAMLQHGWSTFHIHHWGGLSKKQDYQESLHKSFLTRLWIVFLLRRDWMLGNFLLNFLWHFLADIYFTYQTHKNTWCYKVNYPGLSLHYTPYYLHPPISKKERSAGKPWAVADRWKTAQAEK